MRNETCTNKLANPYIHVKSFHGHYFMSSSQHLCEESKAHFPLSEKQKVMVTKPVPAKAEI